MMDENSKIKKEHDLLMRTVFGDEQIEGDTGMKQKVDEIHKVMVKLDGVGGFLKWIIIIGGSLGAIKIWLIK
jgi:hypothetical protein